MATPKVEAPTAKPIPHGETYTPEEAEIVARMWTVVNSDIYIFARVQTMNDPRDQTIVPEAELTRRKGIIDEVRLLVDAILADRNKTEKTLTIEDFNTFIDEHEDNPDYEFLFVQPKTVNKNGWGFFAGLLNPLERGVNFGKSVAVSNASAWVSGRKATGG